MKFLAITLGTFAFAISGALADDTAPSIDTQALLQQLEAIQKQSTTQTSTSLQPIIQQVRAAAASDMAAIALYEQAEKNDRFTGKNTGSSDFVMWKKRQDAKFQNSDTRTALRMQLAYLALTLEKAAGESSKTLTPAIWDYIKQITANSQHIDFDFLGSGIADSEVARGLQCAPYLKNLKDWELDPSDSYSIFKNSLLPLLRADKDPQITQYWDAMIDLTAQDVAKSNLASRINAFNTVQKPQMLWDRAQDIAAIGNRNAGITEMVKIIKGNTLHPNVATWISTLEALLKNDATTAPATTSAIATPAPAPLTTNAPANPQPAVTPTAAPAPPATPQTNYPPDISILPANSPAPTPTATGSSAANG